MNVRTLLAAGAFLAPLLLRAQDVTVSVDANSTYQISPLVYGINAYVYDGTWQSSDDWQVGLANHDSAINETSRRLGGNALTPYNWENGFNNSGNDDGHRNSSFVSFIGGAGNGPYAPGAAIALFHEHSKTRNSRSLLQLPTAGYVAADGTYDPPVDNAPSDRWKAISYNKPGAPGSFTASPDLNDNTVYIDEEIAYLIGRFGASNAGGVQQYQLDNEVGLWHHYPDNGDEGTHSRLHPQQTTCGEIIERDVTAASRVRDLDLNAEIFSHGMFGYPEYFSLWSTYDGTSHQPSDWATYNVEPYRTNSTGDEYRYNHMTWVNAYLAKMANASANAGRRLLDVFAVHYYSDGQAVSTEEGLLQAARSLWDPAYVEASYITQNGNGFTDGRSLELIPKLRQSLNDFYPGTRLAFTEYSLVGDFNRRDAVAGVVQADALGVLGREGVYQANYFGPVRGYITSAFRLYRNYDGANSVYGTTGLRAVTTDNARTSAYASRDSAGREHVILINRSRTPLSVTVNLSGGGPATVAERYGFDEAGGAVLTRGADLPVAIDGSVNIQLPALSATHLVYTQGGTTGVANEGAPRLGLSLAPTPATDRVVAHIALSSPERIRLTILDALGREAAAPIDGWFAGGDLSIPVEHLAAGYYTLLLETADGRTTAPLVVVKP